MTEDAFSDPELKIIEVFRENYLNMLSSDETCELELSGVEVSNQTGLGVGAVYPMLTRLVNKGVLKARWEECNPPKENRRRLYSLKGPPPQRYYPEIEEENGADLFPSPVKI